MKRKITITEAYDELYRRNSGKTPKYPELSVRDLYDIIDSDIL